MSVDPDILVDGLFVAIQDEQKRTLADHREEWNDLADELLLVGGEYLVVPLWWDAHVPVLAKVGREFTITGVELAVGARSACHVNASRLHLDDPENIGIGTGYALGGGDTKWRQHSWAIAADGHIIETTSLRDAYFGIALPKPIVSRWAKAQVRA